MKKLFALLALISTSAHAEDYSIFNPVPDDKLRPFTTERPSKTDSVFTVDSGHLVIESNLFNYIQNDDAGTKTTQNIFAGSTNFRLGLTQDMDFQVIVDAYKDAEIESAGAKTNREGFGDTILRLKYSFAGNDGEDFGIAAIPYVKLPTNQDDLGNDDVEYGLGIPFNYNMPDGWSIGGMTQFNFLKDQTDDSGYDTNYTNALILGKSFTDSLSGYAEFFTSKTDASGAQWANSLDFGVVYAVSDSWRVDTGVNFGVTDAADDLSWFVGTAYRF